MRRVVTSGGTLPPESQARLAQIEALLGVKPGPRVGEVLKAVYELQLDGTIASLEQAIERARVLLEDAG